MSDIPRDAEGYPLDVRTRAAEQRVEALLGEMARAEAPRTLRAEVMAELRAMPVPMATRLRRWWRSLGGWRVPIQLSPVAAVVVAVIAVQNQPVDMRTASPAPAGAGGLDGAQLALAPESEGMFAPEGEPEAPVEIKDPAEAIAAPGVSIDAAPGSAVAFPVESASTVVATAAEPVRPPIPFIRAPQVPFVRDVNLRSQEQVGRSRSTSTSMMPRHTELGDAVSDAEARGPQEVAPAEAESSAGRPGFPDAQAVLDAFAAPSDEEQNLSDLSRARALLSSSLAGEGDRIPSLAERMAVDESELLEPPAPAPAVREEETDALLEDSAPRGVAMAMDAGEAAAPRLRPEQIAAMDGPARDVAPPAVRARPSEQIELTSSDPVALGDELADLAVSWGGVVVTRQAATADGSIYRVLLRLPRYRVEPLHQRAAALSNPALAAAAADLPLREPSGPFTQEQRQVVDVNILIYHARPELQD